MKKWNPIVYLIFKIHNAKIKSINSCTRIILSKSLKYLQQKCVYQYIVLYNKIEIKKYYLFFIHFIYLFILIQLNIIINTINKFIHFIYFSLS